MVSKSSVRLYPAPAAISGNRRTTEKIKLDFDIDSAAVLAVPSQKPMLVGWSAASGLQVCQLSPVTFSLLETSNAVRPLPFLVLKRTVIGACGT